eukprot:scaffold11530_cov21-Tisochrysis_lutea.AAC.1
MVSMVSMGGVAGMRIMVSVDSMVGMRGPGLRAARHEGSLSTAQTGKKNKRGLETGHRGSVSGIWRNPHGEEHGWHEEYGWHGKHGEPGRHEKHGQHGKPGRQEKHEEHGQHGRYEEPGRRGKPHGEVVPEAYPDAIVTASSPHSEVQQRGSS